MFVPNIQAKPLNTQPSDWQKLTISDFSGGLNTNDPATNIRPDQFVTLTNYYIEKDGSIKTRGPYRPYLVTTADTACDHAPETFTFFDVSGISSLVTYWDGGANGEIKYWDAGTSVWSSLDLTLQDDNPVEFIKYSINEMEDLLCFNGSSTPLRISGSAAVTALGLSEPDASTSTTATAASASLINTTIAFPDSRGITIPGTYHYKLTFDYDHTMTTQYGESGASSFFSASVTNAMTSAPYVVDFAKPPTAAGSNVNRVNVYRSPANQEAGPYKYVGYYTGTGTSGQTELLFLDNCPNGEEGVEVPADSGAPPYIQYAVNYKGRVYGFDGTIPEKFVYSSAGQPDFYPALNFAYLPETGKGNGLFKRDVYTFTENHIYVIPEGDVDTYPEPLKVCDKGCASHRSIANVGNGLMWMGTDNVYWADFNTQAANGDYPIAVGEPIKDKIQDIPSAQRTKAVGKYYNNRYYLSIPGQSETKNTLTYAWNVEVGTALLRKGFTGAWSKLDWVGNDIQTNAGTLYTADRTNLYIQEHDVTGVLDYPTYAYYSASGQNITTAIQTGVNHLGTEWAQKIAGSVSIVGESSGADLDGILKMDNADYTKTFTVSLGSGTAASALGGVYGTDVYGTGTYAQSAYVFQNAHKKIPHGAKGRNFQLSYSASAAQDTKLIALTLNWKSLPEPK